MYALHAYFLIGLRCPSGNNKRAMGVTDDSEVQSTMEQERTSSIAPSSFAPSPLWEKKRKPWFVVFAFLSEMLKMAFFTSMPCPAEKYLRPKTD